jgi:DNA-binding response OmpR family regulator
MSILIAEDDPVSRRVLESTLTKWGYEPVVTCDGAQAWTALQRDDAPALAILDWMMPGKDGVQICQALRELAPTRSTYIILLTAKGTKSDIIAGLDAGADDYVVKPFDREELHARLKVGLRIIELQRHLDDRVKELQRALSEIRQLQGIMPICSHCKKIRNDQNYWQQVESYISEHSEARFSHSICPGCFENARQELEALLQQKSPSS